MGSAWLEHVKNEMAKHPGKRLKEVLKIASRTYKKGKGTTAKKTHKRRHKRRRSKSHKKHRRRRRNSRKRSKCRNSRGRYKKC